MVFFISIQVLIVKLCKQTVETLIRHQILWHLIWVCTICLCPTKKDARHIRVKNAIILLISKKLQKFGKYIVEIIFLGTSDLSKFNTLNKTRKIETVSYNKTIGLSLFSG